jgi:hypothetical protein
MSTVTDKTFVDDKHIAGELLVSPSWVRGQRRKRRRGLPHYLTIDPVLVGSMPRYLAEDFAEWMETLKPENDNFVVKNGGQS